MGLPEDIHNRVAIDLPYEPGTLLYMLEGKGEYHFVEYMLLAKNRITCVESGKTIYAGHEACARLRPGKAEAVQAAMAYWTNPLQVIISLCDACDKAAKRHAELVEIAETAEEFMKDRPPGPMDR